VPLSTLAGPARRGTACRSCAWCCRRHSDERRAAPGRSTPAELGGSVEDRVEEHKLACEELIWGGQDVWVDSQ